MLRVKFLSSSRRGAGVHPYVRLPDPGRAVAPSTGSREQKSAAKILRDDEDVEEESFNHSWWWSSLPMVTGEASTIHRRVAPAQTTLQEDGE